MPIKFLLGKWYDNGDQSAPKLSFFDGSQDDIVLTLPENIKVKNLKWISIWCRRFGQNFGDFIFQEQSDDEEEVVQPSGTLNNVVFYKEVHASIFLSIFFLFLGVWKSNQECTSIILISVSVLLYYNIAT